MIYFITYASVFSVIIPIITYFVIRTSKPKYINTLFCLLIVSFLADTTNLIFYKNKGYDVDIVNNIYLISLFLLINRTYFIFWKSLLNIRKSLFTKISFILICLFILDSIFYENIKEHQSIIWAIESLVCTVYAIKFYIACHKISPPVNALTFAPFWLNTAIFLYFSFNLFLFAMSNYIFKNMSADDSMAAWVFHNFNNIIKNILFAVSIYHVKMKDKIYDLSA
jgi:hypothetical protein